MVNVVCVLDVEKHRLDDTIYPSVYLVWFPYLLTKE